MKRILFILLAAVMVGSLAVSCAAPTPQVVKETVVVEKEKPVQQTVVVEKEKTVQQTVVVEKAVSKERTKVKFWHIFGEGASRDAFDKLIADFNMNNPDYIVEPTFTDFWTYDQKVLAAVAAGNPPDVIMADQTRAGQRAEAKQILTLDPYIEKDKFDMSVFWAYPLSDVKYKNQIWGIPYLPDTRLLYYNKDHFKEAGLDPEKPPKTWDELWDAANKLDKKNDKGDWTRVGFNPNWLNVYVLPFAYTTGVEPIVDGKPNFTAPELLETANWYKQWVDKYGKDKLDVFASGFGSGAQDAFISGQVSMVVNVNDYVGTLTKYAPKMNWGIAMIPAKKQPASWGAGFDLEIPAGAKNSDGAWAFIKYLTSKDTEVAFSSIAGSMPSRMDAAKDPSLMKLPGWDVVLQSMAVTKSRTFVLESPAWYSPLMNAITQDVWSGKKVPEQALKDAQAEVEKEISNYKATH